MLLISSEFCSDANKLPAIGWNQIKSSRPAVSLYIPFPINKLRAAFILSEGEIEKLRSFAMGSKPAMARPSTFAVVSAQIWSSLAKSAFAAGEEVSDEAEYFTSPVDCRSRLNPPLLETYFGNCVVFLRAKSTHGRLRGNEVFVSAVEAIAAAIDATVNGGRILDGFENQLQIDSDLIGKRVVAIAGSSRLDPYCADYGLGRATKYDCIHTDFDGAIHICKARDGRVEMGLSMPKVKMDAFADTFNKNLRSDFIS